jgi:hypothetical protein
MKRSLGKPSSLTSLFVGLATSAVVWSIIMTRRFHCYRKSRVSIKSEAMADHSLILEEQCGLGPDVPVEKPEFSIGIYLSRHPALIIDAAS